MTSPSTPTPYGVVFADYLDVTCSPEHSFVDDLRDFCDLHCWPVAYSDDSTDSVRITVGLGVLSVDVRPRFHRARASGAVLAALRDSGVFDEYLSLLGSVPHKVTRLDCAIDFPQDAPDILRSLERRYPNDRCKVSRKEQKVTRLYSRRSSDNQLTGTWYVGHRKTGSRVLARVYDKQYQMAEVHDVQIPPTTRYELEFRKDQGATLRDAAMPSSIFYQYASPALLDRPEGVPEWSKTAEPWVGPPVDTDLTLEVFKRRLESSPELDRIRALIDRLGPEAETIALRVLEQRLGISGKADLDIAS